MKFFPVSLFVCLVSVPLTAQVILNSTPTRVLGQDSTTLTSVAPNLVEGRELFEPLAVALDTSTNPPAIYIADSSNNRVLGWRNGTGFINGQKADIVIGQNDFVTTFAKGPGSNLSTGFSTPSGLAVDAHGNLYVVDTLNNRILRFPQPFNQTAGQVPDLVIGQPSFTTNTANQSGISAATFSFTSSTQALLAFIAIDSSGNLWVADAGNNRVLRFNASVLGSQPAQGPAADLVLGQPDFSSNGYSPIGDPLTNTSIFTTPTGIAFDSKGRLFVEESISTQRPRLLEYNPPFSSHQAASALLGVDEKNPAPPTVSEFQLASGAAGIFAVGDGIGVADTQNNRIVVFPPVEQWTAGQTFQAAIDVAGQGDFSSSKPNQGLTTAPPTGSTLSGPTDAVFFGNTLYVADSVNNRMIAMPQNGTTFGPGISVLGQDLVTLNAPNLTEGREFDFTSVAENQGDAGLAVDLSSNPPHLYVADTYNNRILGWNDLRNLQAGQKADIVIGQPDFQQVGPNYPTANQNQPNSSGLNHPVGLAVDLSGNLYVADAANGRVLRFPTPFTSYQAGTPEAADLVLGQLSFNSTVPDPTPRTMSAPYGLAFTDSTGLMVSDIVQNRVMFFPGDQHNPSSFTSGEAAIIVFGQPDFTSLTSGSAANQLASPRHIAVDTDDRLYVADTGNGRVQIFNRAPTAGQNPTAAYTLTTGLRNPAGIYVSAVTGEIWVADAVAFEAIRFTSFDQLVAANGQPNFAIQTPDSPRAVVEDGWGNLFLAGNSNRVTIYYPGLGVVNNASYLYTNSAAPGMLTSVFTQGNAGQFGTQAASAQTLPLPMTLNGVQVLFNGAAAPLLYAGPSQINFQVPNGAPSSGTADVQVVDTATGRTLGDSTVAMNVAVPGVFTQAGNGAGTAAALNQDNSLNTASNPAAAGSVIQIFGTGEGYVPGGPPDGTAPTSAIPLPTSSMFVIIGTEIVPQSNVLYSGVAPGYVGLWQVNVRIPSDVITLPTNPTQVILDLNSVPSGGAGLGRLVQIYVKKP